jgi:hypothetical protein
VGGAAKAGEQLVVESMCDGVVRARGGRWCVRVSAYVRGGRHVVNVSASVVGAIISQAPHAQPVSHVTHCVHNTSVIDFSSL